MSWWTDFRDTVEEVGTLGMYNPEKMRDQQRMMNEQIKAYREQTELTRKQLQDAKDQQMAEKRRIEEKQIRSLRRNYSSQGRGLLGIGQSGSQDMSNELGG